MENKGITYEMNNSSIDRNNCYQMYNGEIDDKQFTASNNSNIFLSNSPNEIIRIDTIFDKGLSSSKSIISQVNNDLLLNTSNSIGNKSFEGNHTYLSNHSSSLYKSIRDSNVFSRNIAANLHSQSHNNTSSTTVDYPKSVINTPCFQTIASLESINHLPQSEQILLLFHENQALKGKLINLGKNYAILEKQCQRLNGLIEQEKNSSMILNESIKQKEYDHNQRNKNAQFLIDQLLSFVNEINSIMGNSNKIDGKDLLMLPSQLQSILGQFKNGIVKEEDLRKKYSMKSLGYDNNGDMNNQSIPHSDNSYFGYRIKMDCLPCSLGISNSAKGYSPLMCSPNRNKYMMENSNQIKQDNIKAIEHDVNAIIQKEEQS